MKPEIGLFNCGLDCTLYDGDRITIKKIEDNWFFEIQSGDFQIRSCRLFQDGMTIRKLTNADISAVIGETEVTDTPGD